MADHSTDVEDESSDRDTARIRLLDAAADLFYREGVHRVSLERVIHQAGVPESTLHDAFGDRDGLVRAYLRLRHSRTKERIARELTRYSTPRDKLLGVFEIQGTAFSEPGFRGCAFVSASAHALPGEVVEEVATEYRNWLHELFTGLTAAADAASPHDLADQLVLLYDGAGISAWMDRRPATATTSHAIAKAVIDAALPSDR